MDTILGRAFPGLGETNMRIYISDRHPLCRLALKLTLVRAGHEVVGENAELCLPELLSAQPDLVILEGARAVTNLEDTIHEIRIRRCPTKIIIWADPDSFKSLTPEADGLIYKEDDCWERFVPAMNRIMAGEQWIDLKAVIERQPFFSNKYARTSI